MNRVYYVWTGCQSILVPRAFSLPIWKRPWERGCCQSYSSELDAIVSQGPAVGLGICGTL